MATQAVEVSPNAQSLLTWREMIVVMVTGMVIGLIVLALYYVLEKYVFTPALCSELGMNAGRCESRDYYASALAMIAGGIGGLFALVQQRVFRPLLVVLVATIGLWNIALVLSSLAWWASALLGALIFGIAYLTFAWLVKVRNFYIALGVSAFVVVLMRLIIMG